MKYLKLKNKIREYREAIKNKVCIAHSLRLYVISSNAHFAAREQRQIEMQAFLIGLCLSRNLRIVRT